MMLITANPKAVMALYNYNYLLKLMDNSFSPSKKLINLFNKYLSIKISKPVNEKYPFFIKNQFPNPHVLDHDYENFKFPKKVSEIIPPEMDFVKRGDAFIYMALFNTKIYRVILKIFVGLCFGRNFLFNKNIGLFKKRKSA